MKLFRLLFVLLLILLSICLGCHTTGKKKIKLYGLSEAEIKERLIDSLRDLKRIKLIVVSNIKTVNVSKEAELELRKAGIELLTEDIFKKELGLPILTLSVNKRPASPIAFDIDRQVMRMSLIESRFELSQVATLERDANLEIRATTWEAHYKSVSETEDESEIMQKIKKELLDDFLNDYLRANPKSTQ